MRKAAHTAGDWTSVHRPRHPTADVRLTGVGRHKDTRAHEHVETFSDVSLGKDASSVQRRVSYFHERRREEARFQDATGLPTRTEGARDPAALGSVQGLVDVEQPPKKGPRLSEAGAACH